MKLFASPSELFKSSIWTALAGVLGYSYNIVDKAFMAGVGDDILRVEIWIGYLLIFFLIVGRSIGQSVLVVLGKEKEKSQNYLSGATALLLLLGLLPLMIWLIFGHQWVMGLSLHRVGYSYALIILVAAIPQVMNLVLKFVCLSQDKQRFVFKAELLGNLINLLANLLAVYCLAGLQYQVCGIALATLLVQLILFGVYARELGFMPISLKQNLLFFIARGGAIFKSEVLFFFLSSISPVLIGVLIERSMSQELFIAYGVGLSFLGGLGVLSYGVIANGTSLLAKSYSRENINSIQAVLNQIFFFILLLIPILLLILPWGYGINQPSQQLVFFFVVSQSLTLVGSGCAYCSLRAQERNAIISKVELCFSLVLSPLLLLLAVQVVSFEFAIGAAVLIPALMKMIVLRRLSL